MSDTPHRHSSASAWVFPGQGSQSVGMGQDVYQASPAARAIFDEADATLGFALSRLCFAGPPETLTQTENAQPALLTTSIALLAAARERAGDALSEPALAAGHSLGEYSALVAAGALRFADALRLVRRRGELMAAAREGTMAAIMGLDLESLRAVCAEASSVGVVVVANENSPGQLVISGVTAAVERAMELARQRGAKRAVLLNVSAAFHSPLMEQAAAGLAEAVAAVTELQAPRFPVISNVTATPLTTPEAIRAELVAQVTAPVRWIASVERLVAAGVTHCIEIGPGTVLTGLIKRIAPQLALRNVHSLATVEAWITAEQAGQA
ncbi:ACP S-malonyltransferase [Kallotenue papyrolyticum]|uniref:ACP S-malonyltransferase n=1 Tax=Kallotenue papyrolyticum TaxID=1325125 RepID=UPI0004B1848C|nr:ACP S-malonyltransferase [Kallotenue papyrolyticum]